MSSRITYLKLIYGLLFISIFQHCASPKPLTGGPKDKEGPVLVYAVPDSGNIQVKGTKIILKFNEFLNPQSYSQDMWISPNVQMPDIRVNGKKIKVFLKEKLLPEQTYTLVLTKGIVDFHEKNPMKNNTYIPFSTGSFIDEGIFTGKITSAYTQLPENKYIVTLIPQDSVHEKHFTETKPFYFTKTDESGWFQFNYLKKGYYYLFAFYDKDQNNLFTSVANENIALYPELIPIHSTPSDTFELQSFVQDIEAPKVKKTTFLDENHLKIEFSDPLNIDSIQIQENQTNIAFIQENKTTIKAFIPKETKQIHIFSLCDSLSNCTDTLITLESLDKSTKIDSFYVQLKTEIKPDTVLMISSSPFIEVDKLSVQDTSANHLAVQFQTKGLYTWIIFPEKRDTMQPYYLYIPKDTKMLGKSPDSLIKIPIKPKKENEFGSISGICDCNFENIYYVWEHVESKERTITRNFTIKQIKPGTYQLWLFSDTDKNNQWSTGKVNPYKKPEPLYRYTQEIKVKAGFDVENIKIEWKEKK